MDRIEDFQAFVAIVEKGSLTQAAHRLNRSLQSVSRSLAALEQELGIELIHRTTRRSAVTDAGRAFYSRLSTALLEIEAAKLEASNRRSEPAGLLRITTSSAFGPLYVVPAVRAFLEKHPGVQVELELSDAYADLVGQGLDLAIRLGELPDSGLKARQLARLRRVFFAAPSYLGRNPAPNRPEDLANHECIVRLAARDGNVWSFSDGGRIGTVKVAGRFRTSGALAANEAAVQGLGIAHAPLWQIRSLVDRGDVELVLTRFEPPPMPLHALWPATHLLPAKTQLFIALMHDHLKKQQL